MKIFKETQRFNQWWLIAIEVVVLLFVIFDFIKEFQQINNGTGSKSVAALVFNIVLVLIVFLFINSLKLNSKIDEKGISYQFSPIHLKYKYIPWSDLSKCYVRKYAPITEYGGWGIRGFGFKGLLGYRGRGKAYNIKGDMGIQLEFVDGGKLLIGTQNPEKVKLTINNYIHKMKTNTIS